MLWRRPHWTPTFLPVALFKTTFAANKKKLKRGNSSNSCCVTFLCPSSIFRQKFALKCLMHSRSASIPPFLGQKNQNVGVRWGLRHIHITWLFWNCSEKTRGKSEKWWGEGAKCVWGSLSRYPRRVFCTGATPECTGRLSGCTVAKHSPRTSAQTFGALRKGPPFHGSRSSKGDRNSECKLSNGWWRSYKVIKLLLSAREWVFAKLQEDKSASRSSMELYCPWISGPLRVSSTCLVFAGFPRKQHLKAWKLCFLVACQVWFVLKGIVAQGVLLRSSNNNRRFRSPTPTRFWGLFPIFLGNWQKTKFFLNFGGWGMGVQNWWNNALKNKH